MEPSIAPSGTILLSRVAVYRSSLAFNRIKTTLRLGYVPVGHLSQLILLLLMKILSFLMLRRR